MILFSSSKDDDDDGDVGYQLSHGWLKNIVRDPTAVENGNGVLQLLDWQEKRIGGSQIHLFKRWYKYNLAGHKLKLFGHIADENAKVFNN